MQKQNASSVRLSIAAKNIKLLFSPIVELYHGVRTNSIPWPICAGWTVTTAIILLLKIDHFIIAHTHLKSLYPYHPVLYRVYAYLITTASFWCWAWAQVKRKREKLSALTAAFKNAGLESKIGRLPHLISDFALDPMIRKMRLTNAGFPISRFVEQGKFIESELGIFIDEFKENREKRSVELIYSHFPMASEVKYSADAATRSYEFFVGQTRASQITTSFRDTPHLLVAGQTGGGKSTFLRQLIVHTHLKQKDCKFLLIDLKGGLEFSMFEERKAFAVVPSVLAAIEELKKINKMLEDRMVLLKTNHCKDIDGYFKKENKDGKKINLDRQFVIVDEAAEMFLAGFHAKANDILEARSILSRIARQGRAVGIHLVVATQRPDSKSLDPQVKANLTGVICFQMMNDASSIAVLGNGRATDLPKIPGRAIWKNGIEMLEVQTPLLTVEEAEILLGAPDNRTEKKDESTSTDTTASVDTELKPKSEYRTPR